MLMGSKEKEEPERRARERFDYGRTLGLALAILVGAIGFVVIIPLAGLIGSVSGISAGVAGSSIIWLAATTMTLMFVIFVFPLQELLDGRRVQPESLSEDLANVEDLLTRIDDDTEELIARGRD